jgi:hypothetical protein
MASEKFPNVDLKKLEDLAREGAGCKQLRFNRPLVAGKSGAQVWLMHYDCHDGYRFTVLKTTEKAEDLHREQEGYLLLKEEYLDPHLPEFQRLYTSAVPEKPELPVILSCFATPRSTKATPLGRVAERAAGDAGRVLKRLREEYGKTLSDMAHRRELEPLDLLETMPPPDLLKKLRKPDHWTPFGLDVEASCVLLRGRARPNILRGINWREFWVKDNIGAPHVPIHGDLNEDNVLRVVAEGDSDANFVLIDFEKAHIGVPHYDLAFLFVRLLFVLALDRLPSSADPVELAEALAKQFWDEESRQAGLHADLRRAGVAINELFLPLCQLADSGSYPREWQRKTGALALAMACTSLCFYELRNRGRNTKKGDLVTAQRNGMNASFLYALACCLIDNESLVKRQKPYFEFPENLARTPGGGAEAVTGAMSDSVRAAALGLRIERAEVKIVLHVPWEPSWTDGASPDWVRVAEPGKFSYFSKCGADLPAYRAATANCLVWSPTEEGRLLPLVFRLDGNSMALQEAELVLEGVPNVTITGVDLVPTSGGKSAALGIRFGVDACHVAEYLTFVSTRNPGKLKFRFPRRKDSKSFTLSSLERELLAALKEKRAPTRDGLTVLKKTLRATRVHWIQYLLSEAATPWAEFETSPPFRAAMALVISRSLPKDPAYPKNPDAIRTWTHPDAKGSTQYGWWKDGPGAWADSGDSFNATTKNRVVLEALYLQWLMSLCLGPESLDRALALQGELDEDIRKLFFKEVWMGKWKQPLSKDGS